MTFFIENKLFIMGTLLMAGLIAGASSLQGARDAREAAQAPVVQVAAAQAGQESIAPAASPASAGTQAATPVVEAATADAPQDSQATIAPRPSIQGVGDDDEWEDDD